jgi:hypothetical protein
MADLKAQAAAYVDALAERGSPRIVADHRRDIEVQFVSGEIMGGSGTPRQNSGHPRVTGSGGFKRRLTDAIDKMPQPRSRCPARPARKSLSRSRPNFCNSEREEETLIDPSEEGGGPIILRRLDADPRAILCIEMSRRAWASKPERVRPGDQPGERPVTENELIALTSAKADLQYPLVSKHQPAKGGLPDCTDPTRARSTRR